MAKTIHIDDETHRRLKIIASHDDSDDKLGSLVQRILCAWLDGTQPPQAEVDE